MVSRTIPLLLAAGLALGLTGVAAADKVEVEGPMRLLGHGLFRGELSSTDGPKRVHVRIAGQVRFVDLRGDMKVVCRGNGQTHAGLNDDGKLVVQCTGRMAAVVSASNFGLAGRGRQYAIGIPAGVTGTLNGQFRKRGQEPAEQARPESEPAEEEAQTR